MATASASASASLLTMKKPQPLPWTHQEILHLIQAYQEKWYSLKRGQLRASQWEEVAVTVALRCGYDHSNPSAKSGTQCRHKIEKLRKRYRAEKERDRMCTWQYFELMDCLLRGPLPISARPLRIIRDEEEEEDSSSIKSRSLEYILSRTEIVGEDDGDDDDQEEEEEELGVRLAAEMKEFAGRFVRMEKRKIKMMRESKRWRVEMENKRIQMIVDSQKKIVDIIATSFGDNENIKIKH